VTTGAGAGAAGAGVGAGAGVEAAAGTVVLRRMLMQFSTLATSAGLNENRTRATSHGECVAP
jgi:hypothetical protein